MKKIKKTKEGTISLAHMNKKGLYKIVGILSKMGYIPNEDFRVLHVGAEDVPELAVMNRRLKKDIKLISTLKVK